MRWTWLLLAPLGAAELSLPQAAQLALAGNPSLSAARRMEQAAGARLRQTDAALRPKVEWRESLQGGNNPVYVFSSLLTQRQFDESNFAVASLTRPDPLPNFQSQLEVQQTLWDFGRTRARRGEAAVARALTVEETRRRELEVLTRTARAYFAHKLAESAMESAENAIRSAEATLEQAKNLQAAGRATGADVLTVEVELAAAREARLARTQDMAVALAALNTALCQPVETAHVLTTSLDAPAGADSPTATDRPEVRAAALHVEMANARRDLASAMRKPELSLRFLAEADRQRFVTRGGANWFAAAGMRWNLFDGGLASQMRAEAISTAEAARDEQRAAAAMAAMQVTQAEAATRTAAGRLTLTATVTGQARETVRILRNRYGAGLATVSEVLRAEAALAAAETRRLAALHDYRVARVERAAAAGTLTGDSDELR